MQLIMMDAERAKMNDNTVICSRHNQCQKLCFHSKVHTRIPSCNIGHCPASSGLTEYLQCSCLLLKDALVESLTGKLNENIQNAKI